MSGDSHQRESSLLEKSVSQLPTLDYLGIRQVHLKIMKHPIHSSQSVFLLQVEKARQISALEVETHRFIDKNANLDFWDAMFPVGFLLVIYTQSPEI